MQIFKRSPDRRAVLRLAGGFGMMPLAASLAAAADAPIMTRPIPSTGERLPVVGLGTAWKYAADAPAVRDQLSAVVHALAAGGGSVVDSASSYGTAHAAERMLGAVFAEN